MRWDENTSQVWGDHRLCVSRNPSLTISQASSTICSSVTKSGGAVSSSSLSSSRQYSIEEEGEIGTEGDSDSSAMEQGEEITRPNERAPVRARIRACFGQLLGAVAVHRVEFLRRGSDNEDDVSEGGELKVKTLIFTLPKQRNMYVLI